MTLKKILTVTELNRLVKLSLESIPLLRSVSVRGEVLGAKCYRAKNSTWFTMKDSEAEISCVYWGISDIKDGDAVEVTGRISVWAGKGKYQLVVSDVRVLGDGLDKEAFERLVAELEQKGYFDPRNKKPLPLLIQTVALVTSGEGAAVGDVISTLQSRGSIAKVSFYDVRVQGRSAPGEIAEAIQRINLMPDSVDLILLTRGGGGKEDLVVFNDPLCFEAIHNSRIPVVCAVGHERDLSISEKCADVMCITPTDAATLISERSSRVLYYRLAFEVLKAVSERVRQMVVLSERRLLSAKISSPSERLDYCLKQVADTGVRIREAVVRRLEKKEYLLERLRVSVDANSPYGILEKGYALMYRDGKIAGISDAVIGDRITILLKDGMISAEVKEVSYEDIRAKIGSTSGDQ